MEPCALHLKMLLVPLFLRPEGGREGAPCMHPLVLHCAQSELMYE